MSMAFILIKRNIKLFFKDKGMFFTSLITPAILLVLYVTFLGNVYRDSFTSNLPNSLKLSESIIEGLVGGQLISSTTIYLWLIPLTASKELSILLLKLLE